MRRIAFALLVGLSLAACDDGGDDGSGVDGESMFPSDDGAEDERSVCFELLPCSSFDCTTDTVTGEKFESVDLACVDECIIETFGAECGCPADSQECTDLCKTARSNVITLLQECAIDEDSFHSGECDARPMCEFDRFDPADY